MQGEKYNSMYPTKALCIERHDSNYHIISSKSIYLCMICGTGREGWVPFGVNIGYCPSHRTSRQSFAEACHSNPNQNWQPSRVIQGSQAGGSKKRCTLSTGCGVRRVMAASVLRWSSAEASASIRAYVCKTRLVGQTPGSKTSSFC